ncbi:TPA: S24 family peptidase [Vibrio mimicus]
MKNKTSTPFEELRMNRDTFEEKLLKLKELTETTTNSELAEKLGISTKTIYTWKERGKIPEKILLLAKKISNTEKTKIELAETRMVILTYYDIEASAGNGTLVQMEMPTEISFSQDYLMKELHVKPSDVFMMRVSGDSMYPTLQDGALIIVKNMSDFYGDGVYVFRINEQVMVKRLQFQPTKIIFKSDNIHLYEPWEVLHKELEGIDFKILGRVIWGGGKI